MATSYGRTVTTHFGGTAPKTSQLQDEIEADGGIGPSCTNIETLGTETVTIWFTSALSAGEETAMDAVIAAHTPITPITEFLSKTLSKNEHTSDVYSKAGVFIYPGSQYSVITNIKVISGKESLATSYDVRVINASNSQVLATGNFTNDTLAVCDLGTVSNVPVTDVPVEVQVRKNGGTVADKVSIESVSLYY